MRHRLPARLKTESRLFAEKENTDKPQELTDGVEAGDERIAVWFILEWEVAGVRPR